MLTILLLLLIGILSATFGSVVGLGGGIITVPALMYLGPSLLNRAYTATEAVGTSLTVLIITALSSTLVFRKQKKIDYKGGWLYFAASGPASMVGAALTGVLNPDRFQLIFGFFMLTMAGLLIARDYIKPLDIHWSIKRSFTDAQNHTYTYGYSVAAALILGFFVGLVSGLFGIGGGSLFVPVMVILFGYPAHIATATSMFVIFFSSILGSSVHMFNGDVDWLSVAALAPGAWLGGKLGAWIAGKMSGKGLLWILRISMLGVAAKTIAEGLNWA
ncbi:membrane protein [Paenibacillus swuensis]|uniref:Probable membrane transporter protein n=1 Tax=Paenibacillus swuensis TaxID=1178515 RepID=A0A172TEB9_9BACL|nr:sulfite exporter TauE/SafE family protein [Paenibacillus swuensis]ANE45405.1 membrane protein [Paenibacillus swuensis]